MFLFLPATGESHKVIMDLTFDLVLPEELNFDTFWTLEHHFTEFGLTGNLYVACANILGRTQNQRGNHGDHDTYCAPCTPNGRSSTTRSICRGRLTGMMRGLYHKTGAASQWKNSHSS